MMKEALNMIQTLRSRSFGTSKGFLKCIITLWVLLIFIVLISCFDNYLTIREKNTYLSFASSVKYTNAIYKVEEIHSDQ